MKPCSCFPNLSAWHVSKAQRELNFILQVDSTDLGQDLVQAVMNTKGREFLDILSNF